MANIGQIDRKEIMRRYGEEEVARLMGEMVKNNEKIINMQKQLRELQVKAEKKRRQEDREIECRREREQEETDRWMKECRKKNEKKREEREEQRRVVLWQLLDTQGPMISQQANLLDRYLVGNHKES